MVPDPHQCHDPAALESGAAAVLAGKPLAAAVQTTRRCILVWFVCCGSREGGRCSMLLHVVCMHVPAMRPQGISGAISM
jgi:hypothetical protein